LVKTRATPLLTAEEVDAALKKTVAYRPPGRQSARHLAGLRCQLQPRLFAACCGRDV
jgi:hypothetical protein